MTDQQTILLEYAKNVLKPKPLLTGTQWANQHFYLSAESSSAPGKFKTYPYQEEILDCMTDLKAKIVVVKKPTRVGYALGLDTKIPTAYGWSTIGDCNIGDILFDENGKKCNITFKSEVYTDHDCYEIIFADSTKVIADAGHRWLVQTTSQPVSKPNGYHNPKWEDVIDTEEIYRRHKFGQDKRNLFTVKNAKPLECDEVDLVVPPYTLGLWLGDGHSITPRITQHRDDVETAEFIQKEGVSVAIKYLDKRHPNNASIILDPKGESNRSNMMSKFKHYGLITKKGVCNTKHIPTEYFRASKAQRVELLRGLMDSDGCISTNGRAEFNNTNENLIDGVYELLISLGYKATKKYKKRTQAHHKDQWRVNFKADPVVNPFNIKKKSERVIELARPSITRGRVITSVVKIGSVPVQCISVDSKSELFLCTESMIPTHNTKLLNATQAYYIDQHPSVILHYQPNDDEARGYAEDEFEPMIRDNSIIAKLIETPNIRGRIKKEKTVKKLYPGGYVEILGAESDRNLNRRTARVAIGDEIDTWKKEAGKAGDTITTMMRRTSDFVYRKNIIGGKPIGGEYDPEKELDDSISVVDYWYKKGDQRKRYLPCPDCNHYQLFEFEDLTWKKDKDKNGDTIKHYPETAHFICRKCDFKIYDHHKREMDKKGDWIAKKPFDGIASFDFWAMLSYSPNVTWTDIVKEFLDATKSRLKMKAFTNEVLARTWEEDFEKIEIVRNDRLEEYAAEVPSGVLVMSFGADIQKDRIECEVVGWGAHEESWSICYKVFVGDTSKPEVWERFDEFLSKHFTHEDGGLMRIYTGAVDSGYRSTQTYEFCQPKFKRLVFAVKGSKTIDASIAPKRFSIQNKGKVPLFNIGVNEGKNVIAAHIATTKPGPGYMHFPMDSVYDDEYFKQLTGEKRGKDGRWVKIRARNEALDVRNYAYISLHIASIDLELLAYRGKALGMVVQNSVKKPKRKSGWVTSHLDEF